MESGGGSSPDHTVTTVSTQITKEEGGQLTTRTVTKTTTVTASKRKSGSSPQDNAAHLAAHQAALNAHEAEKLESIPLSLLSS